MATEEVLKSSRFEEGGFHNLITHVSDSVVKLRVDIPSRDSFELWREIFCELACCTLNSLKLLPSFHHNVYGQVLLCQYNVGSKRTKFKRKSWANCPFKLTVRVKRLTADKIKKDKLIKTHPCFIVIEGKHTHSTTCDQALRELRALPSVRASIEEYFKEGMSVAEAAKAYAIRLEAEGIGTVERGDINPSRRSIEHMYAAWRRDNPETARKFDELLAQSGKKRTGRRRREPMTLASDTKYGDERTTAPSGAPRKSKFSKRARSGATQAAARPPGVGDVAHQRSAGLQDEPHGSADSDTDDFFGSAFELDDEPADSGSDRLGSSDGCDGIFAKTVCGNFAISSVWSLSTGEKDTQASHGVSAQTAAESSDRSDLSTTQAICSALQSVNGSASTQGDIKKSTDASTSATSALPGTSGSSATPAETSGSSATPAETSGSSATPAEPSGAAVPPTGTNVKTESGVGAHKAGESNIPPRSGTNATASSAAISATPVVSAKTTKTSAPSNRTRVQPARYGAQAAKIAPRPMFSLMVGPPGTGVPLRPPAAPLGSPAAPTSAGSIQLLLPAGPMGGVVVRGLLPPVDRGRLLSEGWAPVVRRSFQSDSSHIVPAVVSDTSVSTSTPAIVSVASKSSPLAVSASKSSTLSVSASKSSTLLHTVLTAPSKPTPMVVSVPSKASPRVVSVPPKASPRVVGVPSKPSPLVVNVPLKPLPLVVSVPLNRSASTASSGSCDDPDGVVCEPDVHAFQFNEPDNATISELLSELSASLSTLGDQDTEQAMRQMLSSIREIKSAAALNSALSTFGTGVVETKRCCQCAEKDETEKRPAKRRKDDQ